MMPYFLFKSRALILVCSAMALHGCVSTEELYAQYDSQMCPVAQVPVPGQVWHTAIFFPYNKSHVTPEAEQKLKDNLKLLQQNPDYRIVLRGFADSVASQKYNLPLSRQRAKVIAQWFKDQGIAGQRIDQVGLGKDLPLIAAVKGQDEQANRRVEILLVDAQGRPVSLEKAFNPSLPATEGIGAESE